MQKIYQGKLTTDPGYFKMEDVLCLSKGEEWEKDDDILLRKIADEMKEYGDHLLIRYVFSDTPIDENALPALASYEGRALASFYVDDWWAECNNSYPEHFDGLLLEEFSISLPNRQKHDFLGELEAHEGQYLYMVIDFSKGA